MERPSITAQKRKAQDKKAKHVRSEGLLPGNVYGPSIEESIPVQLDNVEFKKLIRYAGESDLVDLSLEEEKDPRPVLISEVQVEPVKNNPIHVDFYQVDLTKKTDVNVPIELVGDAPAVKEKRGILLQVLDELPIRALPTEIPHQIDVDISELYDVGDFIVLSSIELPEGVELMVDEPEETTVAKIEAFKELIEEEEDEEEELLEGEELLDEEGEPIEEGEEVEEVEEDEDGEQ